MSVLRCLEDPDLESMLTLDPFEATVHVISMRDLRSDVSKCDSSLELAITIRVI